MNKNLKDNLYGLVELQMKFLTSCPDKRDWKHLVKALGLNAEAGFFTWPGDKQNISDDHQQNLKNAERIAATDYRGRPRQTIPLGLYDSPESLMEFFKTLYFEALPKAIRNLIEEVEQAKFSRQYLERKFMLYIRSYEQKLDHKRTWRQIFDLLFPRSANPPVTHTKLKTFYTAMSAIPNNVIDSFREKMWEIFLSWDCFPGAFHKEKLVLWEYKNSKMSVTIRTQDIGYVKESQMIRPNTQDRAEPLNNSRLSSITSSDAEDSLGYTYHCPVLLNY
jgi:hypothetical protein